MPAKLNGIIRRQVSQGPAVYNVEISAAGIVIREPRKAAYGPIPWGRIFLLGATLESGKPSVTEPARVKRNGKVSRGLLTTGS